MSDRLVMRYSVEPLDLQTSGILNVCSHRAVTRILHVFGLQSRLYITGGEVYWNKIVHSREVIDPSDPLILIRWISPDMTWWKFSNPIVPVPFISASNKSYMSYMKDHSRREVVPYRIMSNHCQLFVISRKTALT